MDLSRWPSDRGRLGSDNILIRGLEEQAPPLQCACFQPLICPFSPRVKPWVLLFYLSRSNPVIASELDWLTINLWIGRQLDGFIWGWSCLSMQLLLVWTLQPPMDCHIEKKKTASATLKLKRSRRMRAGMPERQSSFVACPSHRLVCCLL